MITAMSSARPHAFSSGLGEHRSRRSTSVRQRTSIDAPAPPLQQSHHIGRGRSQSQSQSRGHNVGVGGGGYAEVKSPGSVVTHIRGNRSTTGGGYGQDVGRRDNRKYSHLDSPGGRSLNSSSKHNNGRGGRDGNNFKNRQLDAPGELIVIPMKQASSSRRNRDDARANQRQQADAANTTTEPPDNGVLTRYLDRVKRIDERAKNSNVRNRERDASSVVARRDNYDNDESSLIRIPVKNGNPRAIVARGRQAIKERDELAASRARSESRNSKKPAVGGADDDDGYLDRIESMGERDRQNTSAGQNDNDGGMTKHEGNNNSVSTTQRGRGIASRMKDSDPLAASRARSSSRQSVRSSYQPVHLHTSKQSTQPPARGNSVSRKDKPPDAISISSHSNLQQHSHRGRSTTRKSSPNTADQSLTRSISRSVPNTSVRSSSIARPTRRLGSIGQSIDMTRGRSRSKNHASPGELAASVASYSVDMIASRRASKTRSTSRDTRNRRLSENTRGDNLNGSSSSLLRGSEQHNKQPSVDAAASATSFDLKNNSSSSLHLTRSRSQSRGPSNNQAAPSQHYPVPPSPNPSLSSPPLHHRSPPKSALTKRITSYDKKSLNPVSGDVSKEGSTKTNTTRGDASMSARGDDFCSRVYDYLDDYDAKKGTNARASLRQGPSSSSYARSSTAGSSRRSSLSKSLPHSQMQESPRSPKDDDMNHAGQSMQYTRSMSGPSNGRSSSSRYGKNSAVSTSQRRISESSRRRSSKDLEALSERTASTDFSDSYGS